MRQTLKRISFWGARGGHTHQKMSFVEVTYSFRVLLLNLQRSFLQFFWSIFISLQNFFINCLHLKIFWRFGRLELGYAPFPFLFLSGAFFKSPTNWGGETQTERYWERVRQNRREREWVRQISPVLLVLFFTYTNNIFVNFLSCFFFCALQNFILIIWHSLWSRHNLWFCYNRKKSKNEFCIAYVCIRTRLSWDLLDLRRLLRKVCLTL